VNLATLQLAVPPVLWSVPNDTDCLVMMQQGQVDAISTDNVILQGLEAQDPDTRLVGPAFNPEPYGMAVSKSHPEFTSFVNGVLAAERADGTWASVYATWLQPVIKGPVPAPPAATYRSGP
jgi:polar amino acid transport system substrate-binding protein